MNERITSMDQFRGYAVAGMFVVNFLGGLAAVHPLLKHNFNYFSYADSIMPAFLFAAGFTFRLTLLRRLARSNRAAAYRQAVGRSLALILVSAAVFGVDGPAPSWEALSGAAVREFVAKVLKAGLWNVLAIIGAAQLLVLPVVAAGPRARALAAVGCLVAHAALSHAFNYEFVYGRPNALDAYWGAATTRAWDGGFFGLLAWSVPLLAGTLAYDAVASTAPYPAAKRLAGAGAALMALGYLFLCVATFYEGLPETASSAGPATRSPVIPPWEGLGSRPLASLVAEPPFVPPPPPSVRAPNYWLMDKRVVTMSFTVFGTGMAFGLYALFVLACDRGGRGLELLRVLGQNPLAAYLLHYPVLKSVRALVPGDAPWWWCLAGLALFLTIVVAFVRYLDKHKLYLRL